MFVQKETGLKRNYACVFKTRRKKKTTGCSRIIICDTKCVYTNYRTAYFSTVNENIEMPFLNQKKNCKQCSL